jgi:predicted nucleotidyltransferase
MATRSNSIFNAISSALSAVSGIRLVIVYGSYARGDFGASSDIDLFILVSRSAATEKVQEAIIQLEAKIKKRIQPTIRTSRELAETDSGLLQNIWREGLVLFLRGFQEIPAAALLKQKPYQLYSFQLSPLSQKQKAKFNRQFYARRAKIYKYQGILQKLGGEKLTAGCVIIPFAKKAQLEAFFEKSGIRYDSKSIWF